MNLCVGKEALIISITTFSFSLSVSVTLQHYIGSRSGGAAKAKNPGRPMTCHVVSTRSSEAVNKHQLRRPKLCTWHLNT
jgi:hypothetical protein